MSMIRNLRGGAALRKAFSLILFCWLIMESGFQLEAAPRQPFSITIQTPTDHVRVGDEIKIEITLKNIVDQELSVAEPSSAELYYTTDVRDSGGRRLNEAGTLGSAMPAASLAFTVSGVDVHSLKPGESLNEEIILSDLYHLEQPGKYSIRVQRNDTGAKSNTITIVLTK